MTMGVRFKQHQFDKINRAASAMHMPIEQFIAQAAMLEANKAGNDDLLTQEEIEALLREPKGNG